MYENETKGGVLCFSKPAGCTSHDVIYKIRKLFQTKQVGHTGTLDPMATGVLVIMVGRAVKASEFLMADTKEYIAGLKLGLTTDTEDITGEILTRYEGDMPSKENVESVLLNFTGDIMQVPPMYSALKVGGKKLLDLARAGKEIERDARPVRVDSLSMTTQVSDDEYKIKARVSKGTYIRTLCADIGKALGTGGVMSSLERTMSGGFRLEDSYTYEMLENMTTEERYSCLKPTESLFTELSAVKLPPFFARLARNGCEIYQRKIRTNYPTGVLVRLYDGDEFFAIGEVKDYEDGSAIKPVKQFF